MNQNKADTQRSWWKEAVVYQIYPRSFQDSNGDGIGDLQGIISRLDYIQRLGIDVIWLNPIYASPNDDNGYDISNYREIMADFGTMADFDRLLQEVHRRGLKLVLDLVVNHTSDEHPWFIEASKSRQSPYYDYYHWWAAEKGRPPLRLSYFDEKGKAWKYNPRTKSYYLHYFSRRQPDLNWENPVVRTAIYEMMRFWFDKGIDGFRMDSITLISKDPAFPKIDRKKFPDVFSAYAHGPHLHDYLQEMNREVLSHYPVMTVGEGSALAAEDVAKFVDPSRQELDMIYGFGPSEVRNGTRPDAEDAGIGYSLIALKKMFTQWDQAVGKGWPTLYLGNHDQPRMVSRFGSDQPEYRELSAKMLATFLLTMRGTPYWFAGDELGMTNVRFEHIEEYNDIATRNHYKQLEETGGDTVAYLEDQKETGRDNARTPFQWEDAPYAGFTTGKPWLKVNPDYPQVNAVAEERDPHSVLHYFRQAVALRKQHPGLIYGKYTLAEAGHVQVYAYWRELAEERFLIALNFTPHAATFALPVEVQKSPVILGNYETRTSSPGDKEFTLRPFEALVWKVPAVEL